jgi:FkbM family methyltransferase
MLALQSLWRTIAKPEYLFRPRQLFLRVVRLEKPEGETLRIARLPWGLSIQVDISESIGLSIWRLGIYELVVSEALHRLIDPGDAVADIGANIGYVTGLMAASTGPTGSVTAFEPHPAIHERLRRNVLRWNGKTHLARIDLMPRALSETPGQMDLIVPANFSQNTGTAFLEDSRAGTAPALAGGLARISVNVSRLDEVYAGSRSPAVLKIDVEGSELAVLKGAGELLSARKIRDIVFEDHGSYPTPAMTFVTQCGYSLFKLKKTLFGPTLAAPDTPAEDRLWEPTNYLATSNPDRARSRLAKRGWNVLRPRRE